MQLLKIKFPTECVVCVLARVPLVCCCQSAMRLLSGGKCTIEMPLLLLTVDNNNVLSPVKVSVRSRWCM